MKPVEITNETFENEVVNSDKPVLIDFYATWCGPCKMLTPVLDGVAAKRDDVKFVRINVDDCEEIAEQFGVMSIPMLVVMDKGEVKNTSVGYIGEEAVLALLD